MKYANCAEQAILLTPEYADEYDVRHRGISRIMYAPFMRRIDVLNPNGTCLEVGAGSGLFTRLFADRFPNARITAIDISKNMAQRAIRLFENENLSEQIEYIICDAADSEVISYLGPFDFICSVYSLHHWEEPAKIMENLVDALNPGGILFIGDLRRTALFSPVHGRRENTDTCITLYSREELARLADRLPACEYEIHSTFPYLVQSLIMRN